MTLKETLKQLQALGSEKVRAQNAKSGAGDNHFGSRVKKKTLFMLFFLAFLLRSAYALWGQRWAGDSADYLAIAKNLAFHHSFEQITGVPTAARPPLYPFLIAAFWWTDNAPITAIILVQIICGAAT